METFCGKDGIFLVSKSACHKRRKRGCGWRGGWWIIKMLRHVQKCWKCFYTLAESFAVWNIVEVVMIASTSTVKKLFAAILIWLFRVIKIKTIFRYMVSHILCPIVLVQKKITAVSQELSDTLDFDWVNESGCERAGVEVGYRNAPASKNNVSGKIYVDCTNVQGVSFFLSIINNSCSGNDYERTPVYSREIL